MAAGRSPEYRSSCPADLGLSSAHALPVQITGDRSCSASPLPTLSASLELASSSSSISKPREQHTKAVVARKRRRDSDECSDRGSRKAARCSHWSHKFSHVFLEPRVLKHLDSCSDLKHVPTTPLETDSSSDLQRFARHGGPSLSDLRGYPPPLETASLPYQSPKTHQHTMSASQSSRRQNHSDPSELATKTTTRTTRSSGAYDRNLQLVLVHNNIYPSAVRLNGTQQPEPENVTAIREKLRERRRSLSPTRYSEGLFRHLANAFEQAGDSESMTKTRVMQHFHYNHNAEADTVSARLSGSAEDASFNKMDSILADESYQPRPDIYYGASRSDFSDHVFDKLAGHLVPCSHPGRPIAPNCFVEVKGGSGSSEVAARQLAMVGALGSRAMHSLQNYGNRGDTEYDNNAYTLSMEYHASGLLVIYSHHVRLIDGKPTYLMHRIESFAARGTRLSALPALTAFRNVVDWTREQRMACIRRANSTTFPDAPASPTSPSPLAPEQFEETEEVESEDDFHDAQSGRPDASSSRPMPPGPQATSEENTAGKADNVSPPRKRTRRLKLG